MIKEFFLNLFTRKHEVICKSWIKSVAGRGYTTEAGYSLHLREEDLNSFVKDYWAGMPTRTPRSYNAPSTIRMYRCYVPSTLFKKIKKSKNGLRGYGHAPLNIMSHQRSA